MFVVGKIYHERQGKEQETVCDHEVEHVHPGLSPALEFAAEDPEGDCVQHKPKGEDWDVDDQLKEQNTVLQRCVDISAVLHGRLSLQEKGAGERPSSGTGPLGRVPRSWPCSSSPPCTTRGGCWQDEVPHSTPQSPAHTAQGCLGRVHGQTRRADELSGSPARHVPGPPKQRCSPPADPKLQRQTPPAAAAGWQPPSDLRPGLPSLQPPFRVLATAESLQNRLTISESLLESYCLSCIKAAHGRAGQHSPFTFQDPCLAVKTTPWARWVLSGPWTHTGLKPLRPWCSPGGFAPGGAPSTHLLLLGAAGSYGPSQALPAGLKRQKGK